MKNWIILFSFFCITCGNNVTKENSEFQLKVGDILFQDLDSSPLCDAIELVTPGYKNGNFSHVGIIIEGGIPFCTNSDSRFEEKYFYNLNEGFKVLEALPGGVQITSIDSFLNRSYDINKHPKVIVGRLKLKHQYTLKDAIPFLKSKIGIGYDEVFLLNNENYYCSELIYDAFEKDSIFRLKPMTFLHPETQETLSIWKEYYSDLKVEIPQNKLGTNPGIMSLSDKIEIVHIYGIPENFTE